ncbi:winged helix-turn-helix transcriptional regulator [Nocardia takedensis]|uniref:winged helix-turn-helix transcriptional regulator n=1 Tax=Nocardia takedensis TaxID=259390 RepID=UPI0002DA621C|nr:helix-turn-helix domain-containing protein [Nocardia takedensis]
MPRRTYDHYCAVSRALDVVGDRWSLLLVRELCSGPRRYSDLFADLPGISTDVLAARLKELERDGVLVRKRVGARASTAVYELTESGAALRPVLDALSIWASPALEPRRPTDAVRAHWFALPLGRAIAERMPAGTANVRVGETVFHVEVDPETGVVHRDGPAPAAELTFDLDLDTAIAVAAGTKTLDEVLPDART